jgi:acetyl-CoA C-acetyltransferase
MTDSIVIVDGARTPVGTVAGALASVPTPQHGAVALRGALERAHVEPGEVDDVIFGCVGQTGPEAFNARRAALAAGLPVTSNAMNVNRLCGSGLQAIWTGAMQVMAGDAAIVVAGGNENMSAQPFMDFHARDGNRLGHRTAIDGTLSLVTDPWSNAPMGVTAENVAERHQITREEQDAFALRSQQRAAAAQADGIFAEEIVPVTVPNRKGDIVVERDEHLRPESSIEGLRRLRAAFREGGTVTAGNSSGINDGAAAVVLMRESEAKARGLRIGARITAFARSGNEPEVMGYAPALAVPRVLEKAGLGLDAIGAVELNEAFAAQAVAVAKAVGFDDERLNRYGGAIALGHPVGATGAILALRAIRTLHRLDLEHALVTLCIGGGQGIAMVLSRP